MIYLVVASFIWAFSLGLIKTHLSGLDPNFISCCRMLLSCALFLPLLRLREMSARNALRAWLALVAWAGLITTLSAGWFSGEHTGGFLLPLLRTLFPGAAPETLHAIHAAIRKGAHVAEYLVLGVLLVRALREE